MGRSIREGGRCRSAFAAGRCGDGLLSRACREVYGKRDIIPLPIRIIGEVHLRQGREGLVHSKGEAGELA
jgi:hypothetical protein